MYQDKIKSLLDRLQGYPLQEVLVELAMIWLVVFLVLWFLRGTRGARVFQGLALILLIVTPLLKLLQTDESDAVRAAAAGVLGHYVYEGELEELDTAKVTLIVTALKAAYRDVAEPVEVRRRALESLGCT